VSNTTVFALGIKVDATAGTFSVFRNSGIDVTGKMETPSRAAALVMGSSSTPWGIGVA
jgi:hypothetical protein